MEIYDQHEQGERVRSWLKENISAILTGIVLGLGLIFGYHQWQAYGARQAHIAAELYLRASQAEAGSTAANTAFEQLRKDFPRNGYAHLAALSQARQALADGDAGSARTHLEWVHERTREPVLKSLATLRLARLDLAEGKHEQVVSRLDGLSSADYRAEREELRGDALAALGRNEQALAAYRAAREAGPADPARLEMKLAEFGAGSEAEA